jgi:hypothetical protein
MPWASHSSCSLPFTSDSSLSSGLHLLAAVGGGAPHRFEVDTGSVGILIPRQRLGAEYQNFDPSHDVKVQFVSSGDVFWGEWVKAPVVIGVPATWDGTGTYPIADIEVFAVDRPTAFDGGILGVGFGIGGLADGGPSRNPLLHVTYAGEKLQRGYVLGSRGVEVGLTSRNTAGFAWVDLQWDEDGNDWMQPLGTLTLPNDFSIDLPVLMDTGIDEMLLWLHVADRPPALANLSQLPPGTPVAIAVPPAPNVAVFDYSFVTGDVNDPTAPSAVQWRDGDGVNTGRNVLAGADYLYDAHAGSIGFRTTCKDGVR